MPRRRKYIESLCTYLVGFRAKDTLPLVAYECINFILHCVLARVQRDDKVVLCHDIWNGSHPHLIVVSKDAQQLVNFYAEIQKKVTDIFKKLLDLEYLEIWDGSPSVIKLGGLDNAVDMIAYLYANPGQDNLEDSIENFPGASSWKDFQQCLTGLSVQVAKDYPWIKLRTVPKLKRRVLTEFEDREVISVLKKSNKTLHTLVREPNAWMRCFGITKDSDVAAINKKIIQNLRLREAEARQKRKVANKKVFGAKRLKSQALLAPHQPKKRGRKIYIIADKRGRDEHMAKMDVSEAACDESLKRWRAGEFSVKWPPEAFISSLPPRVSLLPG